MSEAGSKIKKRTKGNKDEGLWLLSFADLSMILISFFILQLSYSTIDKSKSENVQQAMEKEGKKTNNLKDLQEKIEKEVKKQGIEASAKVTYDIDGLNIEFKDNLLFTAGSAESNPKFNKVIGSVMNVIAAAPERYKLIMEGHTDDTPVIGGAFKSNWDLSAARGITLLKHFKDKGVNAYRMSVTAYADTKPLVPFISFKKNSKELKAARAAKKPIPKASLRPVIYQVA